MSKIIEQLTDDLVTSVFKGMPDEDILRDKINIIIKMTSIEQVQKCMDAYYFGDSKHNMPSNTLSLEKCIINSIKESRIS